MTRGGLRARKVVGKLRGMRRRFTRALLAGALVLGPVARAAEEPPERVIRYEKDALTVHLSKVRLGEVVDEIGRQAGARIRGGVKDDRDVSVTFDEVPLPEALHRLLGSQNFALVYGDGGKLRGVKLLGGPQTPGLASPTPPPGAVTGTTLPQSAASQVSSLELAGLLQRHAPIPLTQTLAQHLGQSNASFFDLMNASFHSTDPAVRAEAVRLGVQTIEGDPEMRGAMFNAMNNMDEASAASMLRSVAGDHGEEFLINAAANARTGEMRVKASSILQQFRRQSHGGSPPG